MSISENTRRAQPRRYVVTLRHEGGLVRIGVMAKCLEAAAALVCLAESAPLSAVVGVVWSD